MMKKTEEGQYLLVWHFAQPNATGERYAKGIINSTIGKLETYIKANGIVMTIDHGIKEEDLILHQVLPL